MTYKLRIEEPVSARHQNYESGGGPLIVIAVVRYRIDRTTSRGRYGKKLQQSLSDMPAEALVSETYFGYDLALPTRAVRIEDGDLYTTAARAGR